MPTCSVATAKKKNQQQQKKTSKKKKTKDKKQNKNNLQKKVLLLEIAAADRYCINNSNCILTVSFVNMFSFGTNITLSVLSLLYAIHSFL